MPISIEGLFFTMRDKGMDFSKLRVLYDFKESGQILNKAQSYSGFFSGILTGPNSFYIGSGTGYNTTGFVSIQNSGNFYTGDWSHIFLISRSGNANDNFFSSLAANSGSVNSGYMITSNNAGKLIFSYGACGGSQNVTSDLILNQNSSFAVTKRANNLTFFQYTPNFNILDSDNHLVVGSEIFQSNFADLYYANHAPAGFIQDYYSGYALGYAYFTEALSTSQLISVFSGLYTAISTSGGSSSSGTNDCSGIFFLGDTTTEIGSGNIPTSVSLTRKGVVLLRPFPSGSTVLIDYDTGNANTSWNNLASYDFLRNNFVLNGFSSVAPITYFNGQRVISGLSVITGQFCATGKIWQYDYAYSGNLEIDDADSYTDTDIVVYDIPGKHRWQELSSGTGSVILTDTTKVIGYYLNGQRTKDFTISGTTLTPTVPRISGDIIVVDYYDNGYGVVGEIHNSGFFFTSGTFAQNTSRLYLNGQRQYLGEDYLEISDGSLLTSNPINLPNVIVTNIDNYLLFNL